jgi:hypothetical protein
MVRAEQLRDDLRTCGFLLLICAFTIGWLAGGWGWLAAVYVGAHGMVALSAKI